jgi:hypothetical protein
MVWGTKIKSGSKVVFFIIFLEVAFHCFSLFVFSCFEVKIVQERKTFYDIVTYTLATSFFSTFSVDIVTFVDPRKVVV